MNIISGNRAVQTLQTNHRTKKELTEHSQVFLKTITASRVNNMRGFFLLLLSLMTGEGKSTGGRTKSCEASTQVKGCLGGWVQFTCRCPDSKPNSKDVDVLNGTEKVISSTKNGEWETEGRVSVHHEKKESSLSVFIKQLQRQDEGEWTCKFGSSRSSSINLIKISPDGVQCERPFNQTAYKKAETTLTCEYPNQKYNFSEMFFCKEQTERRGSICEDVSSDEKFNLTGTDKGFSVSISEVSSEDQGVYWCGLRSDKDRFRAGVRKINLKVQVTDIRFFEKNPVVGKPFSYWCKYYKDAPKTKFICKGDDPSVCQTVISSRNKTNGRFSMEDDSGKRNITIRVSEVKAEDRGTYWCGAKSTDSPHSDIIYHRASIIVAPPLSSTPETTQSPVVSGVIIPVIICVIVLLLLLFLSVLIYKRFSKRSRSGTAAGAAPQLNKENYIYEEIPERVQNPDPMKTVYATVDFPRNPSASLLYSTIEFKQNSDKAAGDGVTVKPSSSTCDYSSVKPSPAYTHVNHQFIASEEPLYSTVNKK